jgi:hypothetical protein
MPIRVRWRHAITTRVHRVHLRTGHDIGGVDAATVAAQLSWPTCHYLDLFLTAAGASWLLDRILPT